MDGKWMDIDLAGRYDMRDIYILRGNLVARWSGIRSLYLLKEREAEEGRE